MDQMTRRAVLQSLAIGVAVSGSRLLAAEDSPITGLGVVMYDCKNRRNWLRQVDKAVDLYEPFQFLRHCHSIGAGGVQVGLGVIPTEQVSKFRDEVRRYGMFVDAIISPPKDASDLNRFEAEVKTASEVGVQAARTVIIPGRRYERFQNLAEFREFEQKGVRMVELATPIVEKHQVPLAIENHKDQRVEDRVKLFNHIDSEFVGACIDTGNSFALLDDVYGAIEALAPYAFSVHLKDQAVSEYEDGFLLADIPLGQGSFDLQRMVRLIKAQKPSLRFSLELITRDPLKVPCLTDGFWQSVADAGGVDLARSLRFVRENSRPGQMISELPQAKQVEVEDSNIAISLKYAAEELGL